jgi:2-dehydro-3-deoxyglucarate aldolase
VKQRLAAKQLTLGSWLTMPAPSIAEMMCDAGFEWVTVDLEHSALTIGDAAALIATVSNKGKTPLCRLSSNDPVQIKRVMDAGAHGIIVPMVKNSGDVAAAYQAMHYPPQGIR